ncbi:kinase-like domain-containing protein [Rhizophagus clarus]|uniref:Kinase-like domain-containing protein n=1 Tax=Rhizophagus clarus TaxID=94130 RepID=A0A8H3QKN3_9GLOM|nr:kinase-like domain-containing protein [Rhizophagus clarus]
MWKDGPLHWSKRGNNCIRYSPNEEVALKCLHNSQNYIESVINEAKNYSINSMEFLVLNSSNKEVALKCLDNSQNSIESVINEAKRYSIDTIWKDGPLRKMGMRSIMYYIRESNKEVALKCLHNSQNFIDSVINGAKKYSIDTIWKDGPLQWNKRDNNCTRYSPNKEVALKCFHNSQNFIESVINEAKRYSLDTMWKDGPLHWKKWSNKFIRYSPNKKVALRCLHNSQKFIESVINEARIYSTNNIDEDENCFKLYGMSRNLDTNDYILVQTIWKDGPLHWHENERRSNKKVALKRINNSQNLINELLNEVKEYTTEVVRNSSILKIYGISQDPVTKNYIIVLHYAAGGSFDSWININENYKYFDWKKKMRALYNIASGLKEIHEKKMIHRDFHTGNILFGSLFTEDMSKIYISDMGLCGEVGNVDKTQIYGVLPYVAPEVLRRKPYNQTADIYSFGMIMYFVATGRQPFDNCAHNHHLALDICRGIRPEINEEEAPKSYFDLMRKCWNSNSENRPNITELYDSLWSIIINNSEIEKAENYRNLYHSEGRQINTHPQAIYISRLLNPFTEDLPKYDYNSECSDCIITTNLN